MYRFFSTETKEHRFCVKIIRHFYASIYFKGNVLKDLYDMGPITYDEYNKLKEIILSNENKEEYNFGQNEIPEFYFLFFKYLMEINKNGMFKLKDSINDKYSLFDTLLPDYDYKLTNNNNLCKNKWEMLKLTIDEYELHTLIGNTNVDIFFLERCKNVSNEYHENRKKIKIIDKKMSGITLNI